MTEHRRTSHSIQKHYHKSETELNDHLPHLKAGVLLETRVISVTVRMS